MKYFFSSLLLLAGLSLSGTSQAQTILYTEDFEATTPPWDLNTDDLSSNTSGDPNGWIINNEYAGGLLLGVITIMDTPPETWHTGPETTSHYLHIESAIAQGDGIYNANFQTTTPAETYFTSMNTSINTSAYDSVGLSFHWLCQGSANSYGLVFYRTSPGGAWDTVTTPISKHNLTSGWTTQYATMPEFGNQAFLQFAFEFRAAGGGNDPSFAIDDIVVGGIATGGPTPPVASFTTDVDSVCADGCITASSTSTGTVDSFAWAATITGLGTFPIPGNTSSVTVCGSDVPVTITVPTTVIITLGVFNGSGVDTESHPVVILPLPSPAITQAGNVLSTGAFSSYQWYMNGAVIPGAMSANYTISADGYYQVMVTNSYGCSKMADSVLAVYTGISNISGNKEGIWMNEHNGIATVHANAGLTGNIQISVFDMAGRIVKKDLWPAGRMNHDIDLGDLPQGVYNIHLEDNLVLVNLRCIKE